MSLPGDIKGGWHYGISRLSKQAKYEAGDQKISVARFIYFADGKNGRKMCIRDRRYGAGSALPIWGMSFTTDRQSVGAFATVSTARRSGLFPMMKWMPKAMAHIKGTSGNAV